jgi:hypothetical protein
LSPRIIPMGVGALLCLAGCNADAGSTNHELGWKLEPKWSLGGVEERGELFLSTLEPFQVASDGHERIYVLARHEHQVLVVNVDGKIVDTLGREGQGPGELYDPWALRTETDGGVVVTDLGERRLVRWAPDGTLRKSIVISVPLDDPRILLDGSSLWYTTVTSVGDGHAEYQLVEERPSGSLVRARLERQPRRVGDFPTCHATQISVQPLFAPTIHWSATFGSVAVNASPQYQIVVLDREQLPDTIRRSIAPIKATSALAQREVDHWLLNDCVVPPAEVIAVTGFMSTIPVIDNMSLAPTGELWVERGGEANGGSRIDVFAPDHSYEGTLPEGSPLPAAFLSRDRFVTVGKDTVDVPVVTMYHLSRSRNADSRSGSTSPTGTSP